MPAKYPHLAASPVKGELFPGSKEILLPRRWNAETLEVYAFVSNPKEKISSPSVYIGHADPEGTKA